MEGRATVNGKQRIGSLAQECLRPIVFKTLPGREGLHAVIPGGKPSNTCNQMAYEPAHGSRLTVPLSSSRRSDVVPGSVIISTRLRPPSIRSSNTDPPRK
jgi:hypothetical protein